MKLEGQERERHRAMILSPYKWPNVYLPLKRYRDGDMQVALLRTAFSKPDVEFHIDLNRSLFGDIGPVERIVYDGVDALLDDGWEVD